MRLSQHPSNTHSSHAMLCQDHRFLILASDGVWEYMSDQDAVDAAAKHFQGRTTRKYVHQFRFTPICK